MPYNVKLRIIATPELSGADRRALRTLLDKAFEGDFNDDDWDHTLGGIHVMVVDDDRIVSHASIVERERTAGGQPLRTGYIEGVATAPGHQGRGHGTNVMQEVTAIVRRDYELGALGTGLLDFYTRFGWEVWRGPMYVRTGDGLERTTEEDGYVMVLRTSTTQALDSTQPLACEWRSGDVW